jgi:O-antigen/teichoic acid export membrane protein
MGVVQKDALRTTVISYIGLGLGYLNKVVLMILFLSTEQIGLINLLIATGLLFGQLASLGTNFTIWRFFPYFSTKEKNSVGFLRMMMGWVTTGLLLFTIIFLLFQTPINDYYSKNSPLFGQYSIYLIPIGMGYVFYLLFEVYLRGLYINIISIFTFEFLLRLLITFLLILYGLKWIDFKQLIWLHCVAYIFPAITLGIYLWRKGEFKSHKGAYAISQKMKKIILKYTVFSFVNSFAATAIITIDALMVAGMIGLKATGIYTIVVFLTSALSVPYRSIVRIASPLVAVHWKDRDLVKMKTLYSQVSSVSLYIALVMFGLIWVNRTELFALLPPEYEIGIWLFFILMMGKIFDMYFGVNGVILNTSKKYRIDLIFTSVLLLLVFSLNLLFIPIYGIYGAGVATFLAVVTFNLLRMGFVYKKFGLHPFENSQWKIILFFTGSILILELIPRVYSFVIMYVAGKSMLFLFMTVLPIYYFKLENNTTDYINKVIEVMRKRINK